MSTLVTRTYLGEIILYTTLLKNIPPQPCWAVDPRLSSISSSPASWVVPQGSPPVEWLTICAPGLPPPHPTPYLGLILSCIYLLNACCGQDAAVHCVHIANCTMAGYSTNKTDMVATKPREENRCETYKSKKNVITTYAEWVTWRKQSKWQWWQQSGRGLSEKTKWANQALCLGVWTIPHKGREARAELKKGCLGAASLPAFSAALTCSEVPWVPTPSLE